MTFYVHRPLSWNESYTYSESAIGVDLVTLNALIILKISTHNLYSPMNQVDCKDL